MSQKVLISIIYLIITIINVGCSQNNKFREYSALSFSVKFGIYSGHQVSQENSNYSMFQLTDPMSIDLASSLTLARFNKFYINLGLGARWFRSRALLDFDSNSNCVDSDISFKVNLVQSALLYTSVELGKLYKINNNTDITTSVYYQPFVNTMEDGFNLISLSFRSFDVKQKDFNHSSGGSLGIIKKLDTYALGISINYLFSFGPIVKSEFSFGNVQTCTDVEDGNYQLSSDFISIGLKYIPYKFSVKWKKNPSL